MRKERESARKAFVLGINTAIPYGIVRVGEGYGTVTELLNAVNVTKLLCEDPVNIEKPVVLSRALWVMTVKRLKDFGICRLESISGQRMRRFVERLRIRLV